MTTHPDVADPYAELLIGSMPMRRGDHVGVFYRGGLERDAIVVPAIVSALTAGCGVVHVCDRSEPEEVAAQLQAAGIDIESAARHGQLHVFGGAHAYVSDGSFEPQRTVDFYRRLVDDTRARGFDVLCVMGEMSWSLSGAPGTERLLEYEALYAAHFDGTSTVTLCLYDLEETGGDQILDLLRLHGRVVLNGMELENPHVEADLLFGAARLQ
jgi:hypothetical protein